MKKSLFASLLALSAIGSWAQNSAKDSICVFDGTVTGVPDGTVVYLKLPLPEHNGVYKRDTITTVTGGKFHFEKVIPAGDDCFVGVGKYGYLVNVKLNPGMKTIITGNGMDSDEWIAENEHPDQKEANIYKKYKKEKLADYLALGAQIHAAEAKMYEAQYDAKNEKEAKDAIAEAKRISKQQKALLPK